VREDLSKHTYKGDFEYDHTTGTRHTKTEAFLGKVIGDAGGMTTTIFAAIGDRLGLFKSLAHGPATSA